VLRVNLAFEGMTRVTPASSPSTPWMGKAKGEEDAEGGRPEAGWSALALPLQGELGGGLEVTTHKRSDRRMARPCERPDCYHLRRRRRASGRFRVRVRGVRPWKRLLASLSRSRNLSPAVLLRFLAIFDSFRRDGNAEQHRDTHPQRQGDLDRFCEFSRTRPDRALGRSRLAR
jgi:hypothetical protein